MVEAAWRELGSWRAWAQAAVLVVAFVALGYLCVPFHYPPQMNAALWLPAGLTVAVVARAPESRWPLLLLAVFVAEAFLFRWVRPWGVVLCWSAGTTLRTLVGAALVRRWLGTHPTIAETRD